MGNFNALPHEQVVAYVRGENTQEIRTQLLERTGNNTAYLLLFDIIDRFRQRVRIRERPPAISLPESFAAVEEMLLRFFSGEARDEEAQQLFDGLIASPHFYQRLLAKLALIAPPQALDDVAAMAQIHVRTDDELFDQIKAGATIEREPGRERRTRSAVPVWEKFRDWGLSVMRMPKYAFAVSLLVIVGVLTLYTQVFRNGNNIEDRYVYDEEIPHYYDRGLRAEAPYADENPLYYVFISNFKLGMSDYVGHDYLEAIQTFKNIEPTVQQLMQEELKPDRQPKEKLLRELRDYYFYLGVSHFALARSRISGLQPEAKTQQLHVAIQCLGRADSLAQLRRPVEENDREIYFLGLAYGFSGKRDSARVWLNRIGADSQFYEKSAPLIRAWARN